MVPQGRDPRTPSSFVPRSSTTCAFEGVGDDLHGDGGVGVAAPTHGMARDTRSLRMRERNA